MSATSKQVRGHLLAVTPRRRNYLLEIEPTDGTPAILNTKTGKRVTLPFTAPGVWVPPTDEREYIFTIYGNTVNNIEGVEE